MGVDPLNVETACATGTVGAGEGLLGMGPVGAVELIEPAEGAVSAPLQKVTWVPEAAHAVRENRPEGSWSGSLEIMDRALPRPLRFTWKPLEHPAASVTYELEIHPVDGPDRETLHLRGLSEAWAEVENLRVGTAYQWKVRARAGAHLLGESANSRFTTHPAAPRWIHVPGTTNVRDLGGWPLPGGRRVRQGLFYRGSEMNSHCAITDEGRRVMMDLLGIRTDFDLRGVGEERKPVLDLSRVEYFNIPLASYDMLASPNYTGRYRTLFTILATRRVYPLYIHCWGGADRTGTVAFLLGALLGMRMEDLVTDYELTSLSIWGERRGDSEAFQEMLQTLALFARKGSSIQTQVERYLRVIGISEHSIENLKEMFTE